MGGSFCSKRYSLQKPGGVQDRKSLQKVGLLSDVTLCKHLGTNSRGEKMDFSAFNCLQPPEKADNEQLGGQERLPGAGDVWVGCRQIKEGMGARHGSEKEQEIHPKDWKRCHRPSSG